MFSIISDYFLKDNHFASILGIIIFFMIAFIFSNNKKKINYARIFSAFIMQIILAFFILKTSIGHRVFILLAQGFRKLNQFADAGISFLFGNLAIADSSWGFIVIVKVLPIIIFLSALMSLLFHLGIIQFLVKIISYIIRPILGTSGAETLCAAANSMLGPTEAPLLIKKYVKDLTDSEMLLLMISGMATMNAGALAIYGSMGVSMLDMLAASFMAVPGAILISKILMPETKIPQTSAGSSAELTRDSSNMLDAISIGTSDGLKLAANVAAMLLVFVSLMALADFLLLNTIGYSLNFVFAKIFYYFAYLLGICKEDRNVAGALLGQKLVINELVAYSSLVKATLTERARTILTYALAGFANFSVIGILIGGVGAMAPSKRSFLTKFGLKALLGGTLVNLLNAAIASLLI